MSEPKPPCKGCKERHDLCWGDCEKFKQHKQEKAVYDDRRRGVIKADQDWSMVTGRKFSRKHGR